MYVVKRNGRTEPVHFDKITARITKLSYGLNADFCDPVSTRSKFTLLLIYERQAPPSGRVALAILPNYAVYSVPPLYGRLDVDCCL